MDFLDNIFKNNDAAVTVAPTYKDIEKELVELRVKYDRVVSEIRLTKNTFKTAQKVITKQAQKHEVDWQEKKLNAEHDRVVGQLISKFEKKLVNHQKEIRDLSLTNPRLTKTAAENSSTYKDKGATKRLKTTVADNIKVEKQELENRVVKLDADLGKTKVRSETSKRELNKHRRNFSALQQENGRLRDKVTSLRQENQRLQDSANASNTVEQENKQLASFDTQLDLEIHSLSDLMVEEEELTKLRVQESDEEDCDMEEIRKYFKIPSALSPMSAYSKNNPVERVDKDVQTSIQVVTCQEVQTEAGYYGYPDLQQYMNQIVEMTSQLSEFKRGMSEFSSGFATGLDSVRNRYYRSDNHNSRRFPANLQNNNKESVSLASVIDLKINTASEQYSERDTTSPVHVSQKPAISVDLNNAQSTRNTRSTSIEHSPIKQSHGRNNQHYLDNASNICTVIASTSQQTPSLTREKTTSSTQEVVSSNFHAIRQTPEVTMGIVEPNLRISPIKKSKTATFKRPVCRQKKVLSKVSSTPNENDTLDEWIPPQKRRRIAHVPKETKTCFTSPYNSVTVPQLDPTIESSSVTQPELVSRSKPVPTFKSALSEPHEIPTESPALPSNNDTTNCFSDTIAVINPDATVCMETSEVISQHNKLQEIKKKEELKKTTTQLLLSIIDYPCDAKVEEIAKVLAQKKFLQFPETIVTAIVKVCSMDIKGTIVQFSNPTYPVELTQVQYILLKLLVKLRQTKEYASVIKQFIDYVENVLLEVTLPCCHTQSLGGLHLAVLRIDLDFPRMRTFMTTALASMSVKKLVAYLRLVVVNWPDAFPKYSFDRTLNALVARSFSQVINVLQTSRKYVKPLHNIKLLLKYKRQYPLERESTEELIDALFLAQLNVPSVELENVFLMLIKRINAEQIVFKRLDLKVKPLIIDPSVKEAVICAVLNLVGFVVVHLCETPESRYASETVQWLTNYEREPYSSKVRNSASSFIAKIANI